MTRTAAVERLSVHGREEYLLFGSDADVGAAPAILLVPPLFGEMNRCRRLLADVMRALGALGRRCAAADLPGTGESMTDLANVTLADWREAVRLSAATLADRTGGLPMVAAFRGGALLDDAALASGRWRLAPIDGATLFRDLARAQRITGVAELAVPGFAGRALHPDLAAPLAATTPVAGSRVVRLPDDPRPANGRVTGAPLWRRAEPGGDPALAAAIADDLHRWATPCAAS